MLFPAGLAQHFGELLGFLDGCGTDQNRLAASFAIVDQREDCAIFLRCRTVHLVVVVQPNHRHVSRDLDDFQIVDVDELVRLGQRRAGHAAELVVHAEIVLERDRGERLVLGLDRLVFFGLERLMQPFRIAPAGHHAAGELVDDDDLAVADDVVLVALEQRVGAQRLVDVVDGRDVLDVVEMFALEQTVRADRLLHLLHAGLGQRHGALLLVDLVVGFHQPGDVGVDGVVELGAVVERA